MANEKIIYCAANCNINQDRIVKALRTGVPKEFAEQWVKDFELEHPQENREHAESVWFALKRASDLAVAGNHTVEHLSTDESDEFSIAVDIIADYWGPVVVHQSMDSFRDRHFNRVVFSSPSGDQVDCWVDQHGELFLFKDL